MYKKICLTIHPRNFGSDVSVARTLFRGGGGEGIRCQPVVGRSMLYFLGGKSRTKWRDIAVAFKNLFNRWKLVFNYFIA